MAPSCATAVQSTLCRTSCKKRPSPTHDSVGVPAKRRTGSVTLMAMPPELAPVILSTRKQVLDQEMRTLFATEYQGEVIAHMHDMEARTRPMVETIDMQPELQWYMRPYLIDFLIEIHHQYRLRPETLYLAANIIDRYVSKRVVFKKHYQLVGCAALWIAAKFEDAKERVPSVGELATMCSGAYEESSFIQMEGHVLSTIGWQLGHPTAEAWLRLYSIGAHRNQEKHYELETASTGHLSRMIMELSLFHRSYVGLKSSDVAAGALLLSRHILGKPRRDEDETESALTVARLLDSHLGEHMATISAVVMKKYSHECYSRASVVVKEWYTKGHRFAGPCKFTSAPMLITQNIRPQSSVLSSSSSTTSLSTTSSSSSRLHIQLTPGSLSSLSLASSPTSSVSSIPSAGCETTSSPTSVVENEDCRVKHLICSPRSTKCSQKDRLGKTEALSNCISSAHMVRGR